MKDCKDRKLKFSIRKKKGGGGATSVIIGSIIILGTLSVSAPAIIYASEVSNNSVNERIISNSENNQVDITLNMKYYKQGVILVRSDQVFNPTDFVLYPKGYSVEYMIYSNSGILTPESITNQKITGKYRIRYTLKDSLGNPVLKDGQVVIRNLNIYFYDPTPVLNEIQRVKDKINENDYTNEEEVTNEINKIKDKVENPETIPNIPALVEEVKKEGSKLEEKVEKDNEKYEPNTTPIEKPYGEGTTEKEVIDHVKVPDGSNGKVTVDNPGDLPDGTKSGVVEVPVTVTYPDGTKDHITVKVTTGEQPDNENHKSSNSKVLPKTGEVKEFSSLIGAELLGLAGLLFSMFKRKKEDE